MWKCGSRLFRDVIEKNANQCDKPNVNGIHVWWDILSEQKHKNVNKDTPCCSFIGLKYCNSHDKGNDTKEKRSNFDVINRSWRRAIAWSSAVIIGLYSTQLLHLQLKSKYKKNQFCVRNIHVRNLIELLPIKCKPQKSFPSLDFTLLEKFIGNCQVVHAVSNESSSTGHQKPTNHSLLSSSSGSSDGDLGEVLNSIENRLGLSEIESEHYENGISLLRSAAKRDHPPAIYNLGLCYERGLGVAVNEKIAVELYRKAALLRHAGALYNLGIYYGQGRGGLPVDKKIGLHMIKLAALQGQQEAITAIKALEPNAIDAQTKKRGVESPANDIDKNAPTHSTLFIQNLTFNHFSYEPVVF